MRRLRARLDKLKPGYLDNPKRARELAAAGAGPAEPAASPAALREAWSMGEVVAVTPLQHLIGKPNARMPYPLTRARHHPASLSGASEPGVTK